MRFIPAAVVSAALILAGPIIGHLRASLQNAFPHHYRQILVTTVAGVLAISIAIALVRIRERRALRYALMIAAVTMGAAYAVLSRTGDPAVDAIERFHFVEYGLITLLFYLAGRPAADGSVFVLPVLAGLLVGTVEEWLQWFVPARVGEVRDIFLNLWAVLCGLLFSVALAPPARVTLTLSKQSARRTRRLAAVVVIVFAMFVESAHLGYEIHDPAGVSFRSLYSAEELIAIARRRADEWRDAPPVMWSRYSREDQFFSEGVALVRERNRCWTEGDIHCAWRLNVILERYYAPVIDTPSYVSATGLRWPPEQRADAERRIQAPDQIGEATPRHAGPEIIYTWPWWWLWTVVAASVAMLLWL